jgi:organic radical activating enzyme
MKYTVSNLIIEVTRRCNMCCPHCLRGNAQQLDLEMEHVRRLFDKVSEIDSLTLTGGEPSLVPHIIDGIIDEARKRDIYIGGFYLATNGKHVTDAFLCSLIKLWSYCTENEISSVDVSNDGYHEYEESYYKKLSAFRFVKKKQKEDYELYDDRLINTGRASQFWDKDQGRRLTLYEIEVEEGNHISSDGDLYLNCHGNILGACDLSYEQQDDSRLIVCNVETDDLAAACRTYNERIEEAQAVIDDKEIEEAA